MNILDISRNRSERLLRRAMITLMNQMPYDHITVQDLCDQAELTRPTFYRHYADKQALLNELINDFFAGVSERVIAIQNEGKAQFVEHVRSGYHPGFVGYFQYFRANRDVFLAFLKPDSGIDVLSHFIKTFQSIGVVAYTDHHKEINEPHLHVLLGMKNIANTYITWAQHDMVVSDEDMVKTLTGYWANLIFPNQTETT